MFTRSIQSSTSITFSWNPPRSEDQNGRITAYTISITETGSGSTMQRVVPGLQTTITVSSLLPFTAYFCSIAASTTVGSGPFSTILTVNTPEDSKKLRHTNYIGELLCHPTMHFNHACRTESVSDSNPIIHNGEMKI